MNPQRGKLLADAITLAVQPHLCRANWKRNRSINA